MYLISTTHQNSFPFVDSVKGNLPNTGSVPPFVFRNPQLHDSFEEKNKPSILLVFCVVPGHLITFLRPLNCSSLNLARLCMFLDLRAKAIGHIGGGKKKPTGMIDVALMQSPIRTELFLGKNLLLLHTLSSRKFLRGFGVITNEVFNGWIITCLDM